MTDYLNYSVVNLGELNFETKPEVGTTKFKDADFAIENFGTIENFGITDTQSPPTVTFSCDPPSYSTQNNKVLGKTEQNSQDK